MWQSATVKNDRKIFQYEDFDFDVDHATSASANYDEDDDNRATNDKDNENYSNQSEEEFQQFEGKSTSDNLIPKHRRIYSKWSRWTKCSSKCTTRRYK